MTQIETRPGLKSASRCVLVFENAVERMKRLFMKYLSDQISLEIREAGRLNFIKAFESCRLMCMGLCMVVRKAHSLKNDGEHDFCAFG